MNKRFSPCNNKTTGIVPRYKVMAKSFQTPTYVVNGFLLCISYLLTACMTS